MHTAAYEPGEQLGSNAWLAGTGPGPSKAWPRITPIAGRKFRPGYERALSECCITQEETGHLVNPAIAQPHKLFRQLSSPLQGVAGSPTP